jgi:ABC-type multidrug transport system ATPase subunit
MVEKSLVYSRSVVRCDVFSERVCNRLGIMVHGQLACLGAIQHLKSKFGEGYTIDIKVRAAPGDMQGTTIQSVQTFLLSQARFQVQVREITHSTGSFQIRQGTPADLFELLEQNKQQLSIETYTISQTTLEQIFLSFGKHVADV